MGAPMAYNNALLSKLQRKPLDTEPLVFGQGGNGRGVAAVTYQCTKTMSTFKQCAFKWLTITS